MTYTRQDDEVILQMSAEDYDVLQFIIRAAIEAARDDRRRAYNFAKFLNDINHGNPDYQPYPIPPEFG